MQQSNKTLLRENLSLYLSSKKMNIDLSKYRFVIKIDQSDDKNLSSNIEEIINFWVLPRKVNQSLEYKEAIDLLVSGSNEIPLWIGVRIIDNLIQLIISKRFKKLEVIKDWHNSSRMYPFISSDELNTTKYFKEFKFAYPASMDDDQKMECEEFQEVINIMNLGDVDFTALETRIWENVENSNADILKIMPHDNEMGYMLIDLWNSDQINVMNLYFKVFGADIDFVYRSLTKWNDRLWTNLGPKIEEINDIESQKYVVNRNILLWKTRRTF